MSITMKRDPSDMKCLRVEVDESRFPLKKEDYRSMRKVAREYDCKRIEVHLVLKSFKLIECPPAQEPVKAKKSRGCWGCTRCPWR